METMVIDRDNFGVIKEKRDFLRSESQLRQIPRQLPNWLLCCCSFVIATQVYAFEWQVRPNLSMSEMFDDNLALASIDKKSGFVTEVSPGFNLNGQSPWSNFNLNYRLQGLYNAQGSDAVDVFHQLQTNSLIQAVPNTLFLQSSSSISQQNISNSLIATDNIAGNRARGGSVQNENFSIYPYFTPHFGQYASGLLKGGYSQSSFSDANTNQLNNLSVNGLSRINDSETILKQAQLTSGSYFNIFSWNLNYSSQNQHAVNGTGIDTRFESYRADGRYYLGKTYNVFAQTGYENNNYELANSANGINNGFFYTVGAQWKPSLWYSLEVGGGNNSHVTMQYNPSSNLTSHITYNNKNVGLNHGSSWDVALNYQTPMTNWGLKYLQDTTTVAQIYASQNIFNNTSITSINNPARLGLYSINGLNLVNDVLIRKRADVYFSYLTGKSTYNANVYNEQRNYQITLGEDTVYGVTGGWQWQFLPRFNFYLQPLWQSTKSTLTDSSNNMYQVGMGLTRGIPINLGRPLLLNTTLDLRHIELSSSGNSLNANSYIENRATANFFVQF